MFWKARVKYEIREERSYDTTWTDWKTGTFYGNELKRTGKIKKKLSPPLPDRNVFSNLSIKDI